MTEQRKSPGDPAGGDARLVETMREHYAPPEMTPAETAAFNAALWKRIERRRARPGWLPTLVAAGAVAAAAWLALPSVLEVIQGSGAHEVVVAEQAAPSDWERDLADPTRIVASNDVETAAELPDDYAAIASAFLGG